MAEPVRARDDKSSLCYKNLPPKERAMKALEHSLANMLSGCRRAEAALAELRRLMK